MVKSSRSVPRMDGLWVSYFESTMTTQEIGPGRLPTILAERWHVAVENPVFQHNE